MRIRRHNTMFAALYGELVPHPWPDPHAARSDAYSLFVARSSAMGCLADAGEGMPGGLWAMNDAGHDQDPASGSSHVLWFQVSTEPVPAERPLPVQAFLSCAGDVVERIGTLRLEAVQVLLPLQSIDASTEDSSPLGSILQAAGWFDDCSPQQKASVEVTLDGGQELNIHTMMPEMFTWMRALQQDVFSLESFSLADKGMKAKPRALSDLLWRGPSHHRVTFHGTLAEWSVDALGWVACLLAHTSYRHGVSGPLMFTASQRRSQ